VSPSQRAWRRSRLEPSAPRASSGNGGRAPGGDGGPGGGGPDADGGPFTLVVADLHNHSLNSDGRGDPEQAFEQMRAAGLDVAALTDHASIPLTELAGLGLQHYPDEEAVALGRLAPRSFDLPAWHRTGELADKHDVPGEFTAIRGFEWTEPWLGHVNVWFSGGYLQVTTPGSLQGLHDWLTGTEPGALFGYNHPGREPGRLAGFALPQALAAADGDPDVDPGLLRRMVALEAFNRTEDFLFGGYAEGLASPIAGCLDAGWRPGLIGCSDEHGRSYGLAGKGRTGLWVREHSRDGVREALSARRSFATREVGLRLDATLDGVRMGSTLPQAPGGAVELAVDLGGSTYEGREVELQLLASAARAPSRPGARAGRDGEEVGVLARVPARVGAVTRARVELPEAAWVLLRVADPRRGYGGPAPTGHPCSCWAVAYSSPWYSAQE
jgi:hypothetical protein